MTLSTDEAHALRSFSLWTLKPELIVINTAEGETVSIEDFRKETGIKAEVFAISALVEGEIASLPQKNGENIWPMLGIEERPFPGSSREPSSYSGRSPSLPLERTR